MKLHGQEHNENQLSFDDLVCQEHMEQKNEAFKMLRVEGVVEGKGIAVNPLGTNHLSLNPQSWHGIRADGAIQQLVAVNSNTTWSVSANVSWITFPLINVASFNIGVGANTGPARNGEVTVTGGGNTVVFPVSQLAGSGGGDDGGGGGGTLSFSIQSWDNAPAGASSLSVFVTSSAPWTAISNNPSWMTVGPDSGPSGLNFVVNTQANTGPARNGSITVSAGNLTRNFHVHQLGTSGGGDDGGTLSFSIQSWDNAPAGASSLSVFVTSSAPWTAISNNPSWMTVGPDSGPSGLNFVVNTQANTGPARNGSITVTAGGHTRNFHVHQLGTSGGGDDGGGGLLNVSPSQLSNVAAGGASQQISVTSNVFWMVNTLTPWIGFEPNAGNGNGSFTLTLSPNHGPARSGSVTVTGGGLTQTVHFSQLEANRLDLSLTNWDDVATGGCTQHVIVTANVNWTVSASESWLVVAPANGSNNGSFVINPQANTGPARTGTVTVSGGGITREIAVSQQSGQITITFNPNGGTTSLPSRNITPGSQIGTLPTAARAGSAFLGWFIASPASGDTQIFSNTIFHQSTTAFARWRQMINYDIITLNPTGGSVTPWQLVVENGRPIGPLPTPTRSGHSFVGWFTTISGSTQVLPNTVVQGSKTIFARWTSVVTITLDPNGGTLNSPAIIEIPPGTSIPLGNMPTNPTRPGYTFDGWTARTPRVMSLPHTLSQGFGGHSAAVEGTQEIAPTSETIAPSFFGNVFAGAILRSLANVVFSVDWVLVARWIKGARYRAVLSNGEVRHSGINTSLFALLDWVARNGGEVFDLLSTNPSAPIYRRHNGQRIHYGFRRSGDGYTFLGSTANPSVADSWFHPPNTNSHVFKSDEVRIDMGGTMIPISTYGNSFRYLKGSNAGLSDHPNEDPAHENYAERSQGGFVYKWSHRNTENRGVSAQIHFPIWRFRSSQSAANLNAFIYCAVNIVDWTKPKGSPESGYWAELCIMPSANYQVYGHIAWAIVNGNNVKPAISKPITSNPSGIDPNAPFDLRWEIRQAGVVNGTNRPYRFAILVGGVERDYLEIPDELNVNNGMHVRFMTGTSYVQDPETNIMDIRNGGFMERVIWEGCSLITTNGDKAFSYNSPDTETVLVYNDAICGARQEGNWENINIFHDGRDPWVFS